MPKYTGEDLQIVEGGIAYIRKHSSMYVKERPWGPSFASYLMKDIIFHGALPAQIEKIEGWWVISSGKDWLASLDGSVSLLPFSKMMPTPTKEVNSHNSEVVIAALADAVVTCGRDGLKWINGDPDRWRLSSELVKKISSIGAGRTVAFTIGDEL